MWGTSYTHWVGGCLRALGRPRGLHTCSCFTGAQLHPQDSGHNPCLRKPPGSGLTGADSSSPVCGTLTVLGGLGFAHIAQQAPRADPASGAAGTRLSQRSSAAEPALEPKPEIRHSRLKVKDKPCSRQGLGWVGHPAVAPSPVLGTFCVLPRFAGTSHWGWPGPPAASP